MKNLTEILITDKHSASPTYDVNDDAQVMLLIDGEWKMVDKTSPYFIYAFDTYYLKVPCGKSPVTEENMISLFHVLDDMPDWEYTYDHQLEPKELPLPFETKHKYIVPYPEYLGVIVERDFSTPTYGAYVYLNSIRREIKNEQR